MKVELIGSTRKEDLEQRIKIVAAAGKLSRFDGDVFEVLESCNDYEKNLKLIKRIIEMGHESITDHDYLVFAIEGVSPIIEQTIIEERFASFTIKSRREVNFANVGYYIPVFKDKLGIPLENQEEIKDKYCKHMDFLFESYQKLVDMGINKEDSRFVLPYSYHSNIIMGIDARVFKKMIVEYTKGVRSNISEIKEFGEMLYDIMVEHVPYYKDVIDKIEISNVDLIRKKMDEVVPNTDYKIIDKPILISYSNNIDDNIIIFALMYKYQYEYEKALKIYESIKNDSVLCEQLIKEIYNTESKILSQVSFQFQIPVSLAVLTHITRHRTHAPLIPGFVPIHNLDYYKIPFTIKNKCLDFYKEIYEENIRVYEEFKQMSIRDEDLIYFHLSGNMVNMTTNMDGDTLSWITRLRVCNKAQWEIRNILNEIRKQVKEVAPLYSCVLGPDCETKSYCGEGKESCGKIRVLERK